MTLQDKDRTLFGTKVKNNLTDELGVILYTWTNSFWACGGTVKIPYATCIDMDGHKYNIAMDDITQIEE